LTTLRDLNQAIYDKFSYTPKSTRVDSPIDEALLSRQGVCQDFSHIMIALVRELGIPCRYVSGYLYHGEGTADRSTPGATHAWVEALLPGLGWVGFDPTNNLVASNRHIRVAVGRDYDDVPPTRGVFTGDAKSELSVDVKVELSEAPILEDAPLSNVWVGVEPEEQLLLNQQAQQQQQ
jgi:transglutaminase-like putative cysteine protease